MRKWVVIGLLAIIGVGVLVYAISQPKPGSIKYHRREYCAAVDRLAGRTLSDRMRHFRAWITQTKVAPMSAADEEMLYEQLRGHEKALIDLGFLQRREFIQETKVIVHGDEVTIQEPIGIPHMPGAWDFRPNGLICRSKSMSPYARALFLRRSGKLVIVVIGVTQDMPLWEQSVDQRDVLDWF